MPSATRLFYCVLPITQCLLRSHPQCPPILCLRLPPCRPRCSQHFFRILQRELSQKLARRPLGSQNRPGGFCNRYISVAKLLWWFRSLHRLHPSRSQPVRRPPLLPLLRL